MLKNSVGPLKRERGNLTHGDFFSVLTMIVPVETGSFAKSVYGQHLKILRIMQEI